jgi:ATP-dependent helicase/nuclease subunit A
MHADDRLREDDRARQRALELDSFIVEAPAGAGKTELLTQRTLRLLAVVAHPEEVLALTFTNKAAAEMRDRILGSLALAQGGELPDSPHKQQTFRLAQAVLAHDQQLGWGLLDHPGRLRITTLDALCASLARQMPYLSRFGAQPGVAEVAETHYRTAARRTLELLEEGDEHAEVVAAALTFMDNDAGRLERLLVDMLGRRDQWLPHLHRLDDADLRIEVEAGFAALIERDLAAVATLVDARLQSLLMPPVRFAASQLPELYAPLLDWQQALTGRLEDRPAWQALAGLLLTGTGSLRKTVTKAQGFPADPAARPFKEDFLAALSALAGQPAAEAALARLLQLPPAELSEEEWSTVHGFSQLLRLATGQLWLAFQASGEVDFVEIAQRAAEALGDEGAPTDLAQALDYRISHLLVDEFQDTSPNQVGLIEKLTRGWTPGDGRTLFVVGDPMQSIYRFRKADVGLFLRVRAQGIGDIRLENLRLCRNNRSYPGVVDWVNRHFSTIFPEADSPERGAVRYADSVATKSADPAVSTAPSGVHLHALLVDDAEAAAQLEAQRIVAIIRQTWAERPADRIAILVRARTHLDALVAELQRRAPEIRYQAVDIDALGERQHVQDLLSLQKALWHRADRVHWLAVLRAPWCGLTLADLHALVSGDKQRTVWQLMNDNERIQQLSADGQERLQHVRAVLALAFAERGRQPPRRWLESVWVMLGGPRCLDSAAALPDVQSFFCLVDRLVAAGRYNAETLLEQVQRLFAPADALADDRLQMMTIHKAKGLEFETVILPGLQRETGGNDSSLLLWDGVSDADGNEQLLVAPMRPRGDRGEAPTAYDFLRRLEADRSAHEDTRLLYVAATRTIRQLHLIGSAVRDPAKADGLKPPPRGTLLNLLWEPVAHAAFLQALAEPVAVAATGNPIDPATFVPDLIRQRQPAVPEILAMPPASARRGQEVAVNNQADEVALTPSLEAAIGTLVHRCLELITNEGLAGWNEARIQALAPAYRRWLQANGQDAAGAASGAAQVVEALGRTLASADGRWLLAQKTEAAAEQAWSSLQAGVTVNHVIDRVFVSDGVRWIVDYKTVRLAAGETAAVLGERAETYRPQLARYAGLFADGPLPTRLAIFFPFQGVLVKLP